MNNNPFQGIDLPKVKFEGPDLSTSLQSMNSRMRAAQDALREQHEREERYKKDTLNTLKNIEKNTGDISQLVSLLHENSDKQTEILEIMTNIMSIGTSSTPEEAESRYRTVMNKINETIQDAETMEKLLGYGKLFYHSAKAYLQNRIENGS
ncbi:hypothetical protein MPH47_04200 [Psychrobacillus psychrodurans]|uniref:hypothetical protein n=1 Tax=Psychrobacillus psychrodurans TaxID=126157 RepID=UPI001F4EA281|nr:hypothetical protein [Psychrobacillus psychrodurans]MCK1996447.1 hypothetical protein [Psychrobacillus psychrodurans]